MQSVTFFQQKTGTLRLENFKLVSKLICDYLKGQNSDILKENIILKLMTSLLS